MPPKPSDRRPTLVCAGHHGQFKKWLATEGHAENNVSYVEGPVCMVGMRRGRLILIGIFWQRHDAARIVNTARICEFDIEDRTTRMPRPDHLGRPISDRELAGQNKPATIPCPVPAACCYCDQDALNIEYWAGRWNASYRCGASVVIEKNKGEWDLRTHEEDIRMSTHVETTRTFKVE